MTTAKVFPQLLFHGNCLVPVISGFHMNWFSTIISLLSHIVRILVFIIFCVDYLK